MVSISLLAAEYAPSHSHTIIGAATARRALAHRLNRERPRPQDSSFPSGRSDTQPVPAGGEVKTNGVWALLSGIAVSPVGRRGFASPFEVGPQLRWFLGRQGSCSWYSHRSKKLWPTPRDCVHPTSLCASCLRRGRSFWASRLSSCLSTSETVSTSTARSRPLSLPRAAGNSSMLPEFAHSHH